ncbi:hypothetical protein ACSBR2_018340 [Camellia fascicularis]
MAQPNNHDAVGRSKSKSKGPPVQRKPLKHRDYEVDLESRLGKTQVVTPIAPLSQQAGYFCSVCKCVVKDSANYLDHINGKKYQRALGMSMRVERASLQQVQERFQLLKKRKDTGSFTEQDFDEQILKQQQEEEERKRQRRERKKEKVFPSLPTLATAPSLHSDAGLATLFVSLSLSSDEGRLRVQCAPFTQAVSSLSMTLNPSLSSSPNREVDEIDFLPHKPQIQITCETETQPKIESGRGAEDRRGRHRHADED